MSVPRDLYQALGFLFGLWIALALSPLAVQVSRAAPGGLVSVADLESSLHRAVNEARTRHHLIPLERVEALDAVARAHSEDMARRGFTSHESPEGASPVDRLARGGVEGFTLAAENIGRTTHSDPNREILQAWLSSAAHRKNLLAPPFNATGIGIALGEDGSLVYTQLYVTYPR